MPHSPEWDENVNNLGRRTKKEPFYKESPDQMSDKGNNSPDKILMEKEERNEEKAEELSEKDILKFQSSRDEPAPPNNPRPDGRLNVKTQDFIEMNRGIHTRIKKLEAELQDPKLEGSLRKEKALRLAGLRTELNPHGKREQPQELDQAA